MNKNTNEKKIDTTNLDNSNDYFVEDHLKGIGVKKESIVLDFGCGDVEHFSSSSLI